MQKRGESDCRLTVSNVSSGCRALPSHWRAQNLRGPSKNSSSNCAKRMLLACKSLSFSLWHALCVERDWRGGTPNVLAAAKSK